jgi:hypothetical protein
VLNDENVANNNTFSNSNPAREVIRSHYSKQPLLAFYHPSPKNAADPSKLCGVVRIDQPGLFWIFAELGWSDTHLDRVLYTTVKLSPKRE